LGINFILISILAAHRAVVLNQHHTSFSLYAGQDFEDIMTEKKAPIPAAARRKDMQDGMLAHYLAQAKAADVNVEARIDREPFDFRSNSRQG
jgi:hypothetical protein